MGYSPGAKSSGARRTTSPFISATIPHGDNFIIEVFDIDHDKWTCWSFANNWGEAIVFNRLAGERGVKSRIRRIR